MPMRLLMLDVDDSHSKVVREQFASWTIDEAGASSLAGRAGQAYDLVIANARDTREQTLALCSDIRNEAGGPDVPILVTLERFQANQVQYILESGRSRCLIKSFGIHELSRAVAGLLAGP